MVVYACRIIVLIMLIESIFPEANFKEIGMLTLVELGFEVMMPKGEGGMSVPNRYQASW